MTIENKTIEQVDREWRGIEEITVLDNNILCLNSYSPYAGTLYAYIKVTDEQLAEIRDHYYYSTIFCN